MTTETVDEAEGGVLIAPLWNWNISWNSNLDIYQRSNRTFMELKSMLPAAGSAQIGVLIAPLWNWNFPKATEQSEV